MTITLDEAKARVTPLVEANPEFVYKKVSKGTSCGSSYGTCAYFDPDNKPSCLVGQAFANELRELGVGWGQEYNESSADDVFGPRPDNAIAAEREAAAFLLNVQNYQDKGRPWGEALHLALTEPEFYMDEDGFARSVEPD